MDRVCAVIVTYNRKELLRECLRAVLSQTRPPDHVLVVDNASTDGTPEMLREEFPEVEVLRLPENQGGAGGFHEGMRRAYEGGYEWIWIMDDDAKPKDNALEALLRYASTSLVLVPVQIDSSGRRYGGGKWFLDYRPVRPDVAPVVIELFTFVGPLLHRVVIESVGFPRKDFFIWWDDLEWSLRISMAGFRPLMVPEAVVFHDYGKPQLVKRGVFSRWRYVQPPWKFYYFARNGWLFLDHYSWPRRLLEKTAFLWVVVRGMVGDVLFDRNWRQKTSYRLRGLLDGMRGRTGKAH